YRILGRGKWPRSNRARIFHRPCHCHFGATRRWSNLSLLPRASHRPAGANRTPGKTQSPSHGSHHTQRQLGRRLCPTRRPPLSRRRPPQRNMNPSPANTPRRYSPLVSLIIARLREFTREPEALFWVYGFPILLTVCLGIAFRNQPVEKIVVDVVE